MAKGNARDSGYARDPHDFYVEDEPCVESLFAAVDFPRDLALHDPCCGSGTIPRVAERLGLRMTGSDLIDRRAGMFGVRDFLTDPCVYPGIVTNPPFGIAEQIIRHALAHVAPGGRIAALVMEKFLYSQARRPLFSAPETESVLILCRRPSMPPGAKLEAEGEACRGGGSRITAGSCGASGRLSRAR